jgi:hypothetical protein
VEPGEVLVGLGDERRHGGAVVLNHKPGTYGAFRSVTEYVCSDAAPVEAWREKVSAEALHVVVEDASLDTCYGLLAFLERMEPGSTGVPLSGPWVEYVTAWEQGGTPGAGPLEQSVGVLLGQVSVSREASESLRAGLDFLHALASREADPLRVDFSRGAPHLEEAQRRVVAERARFEALRKQGDERTLWLPRADGAGKVPVRALVMTYTERLGLLGRLARASGFGLTAFYCEAFAGTGGDMVVATDPSLGVTLRELWEALERLEDERWGPARPRSHPRRIKSYAHRTDGPDEPWWDDLGRYSLVAAPKAVTVDGARVLGSRVGWDEVKEMLSILYEMV